MARKIEKIEIELDDEAYIAYVFDDEGICVDQSERYCFTAGDRVWKRKALKSAQDWAHGVQDKNPGSQVIRKY